MTGVEIPVIFFFALSALSLVIDKKREFCFGKAGKHAFIRLRRIGLRELPWIYFSELLFQYLMGSFYSKPIKHISSGCRNRSGTTISGGVLMATFKVALKATESTFQRDRWSHF